MYKEMEGRKGNAGKVKCEILEDRQKYPLTGKPTGRSLTLCVDDAELERRRAAWKTPEPRYKRGWGLLFSQNVTQAHEGCDFDFLQKRHHTADPEIH